MRLRTACREAWLNVMSLASGTVLLVVGLAVLAVGLAGLDVGAIRSIGDSARAHLLGGGATFVVASAEGVDGRSCEALSGATGIHAAAALRDAGTVVAVALPGFPVTHYEMSRSAADVLHVESVRPGMGVFVDRVLADELALTPGSTLVTEEGRFPVAGVFAAPTNSVYERSVVTIAPAGGTYGDCLVTFWPPPASDEPPAVLQLALRSDAQQPTIAQLDSTAAVAPAFWRDLRDRPTGAVRFIALAVAGMFAAAFVRRRRLELAASMMCGTSRAAVTTIVVVEVLLALALAMLLAAPYLLVTIGGLGERSVRDAASSQSLAVVAATAAGALIGALVAVTTVRQHHLFRYFQDRS